MANEEAIKCEDTKTESKDGSGNVENNRFLSDSSESEGNSSQERVNEVDSEKLRSFKQYKKNAERHKNNRYRLSSKDGRLRKKLAFLV